MKHVLLLAFAALGLIGGVASADPVSDAQAGQDALNRNDYLTAVAAFTRAIDSRRLAPSDLEGVYVERAAAYAGLRQFDWALADLDLAAAITPNDPAAQVVRVKIPPTDHLDQAEAAQRGATLVSRGDNDGALTALNRAISMKPDDEFSLYERGLAWLHRRNYDQAIADFTAVIRIKPETWGAYAVRGEALAGKGDLSHSLSDYNDALRLHPGEPATFFGRGQTYALMRDVPHAVADFTEALRTQPSNEAFLYARCTVRAAGGVELGLALADCNHALQGHPNDANLLDARGFVYFRAGRFDEAIADDTEALRLDPRHASSLYVRGLAEARSGQGARASDDIHAAQALDPKVGDYYAHWGIRP
jgi:tetratricopeptide (TPR) repeat protein